MKQGVRLVSAIGAFGVTIVASAAVADYPSQPIQLTVNFGAGGTSDVVARAIAQEMEEILDTDIVVNNRAGAGGTLGVAETARSDPDGYHIGTVNMPAISIIPHLRSVPYDPFEELIQIGAALPYEYAVIVRDDAPWDTWDELVDYMLENPGEVRYGSVGTGTTNHLAMARMAAEADFEWTHVPFDDGVSNTSAVAGGHIEVMNNTLAAVASMLEAGELRALLVTSERRFDLIPDVPTMEEAGFNFSQISYMSFAAPAGVPDRERSLLEDALEEAVASESVKEAAANFDARPSFISGSDYTTMLQDMSSEWSQVIDDLEIEVEE